MAGLPVRGTKCSESGSPPLYPLRGLPTYAANPTNGREVNRCLGSSGGTSPKDSEIIDQHRKGTAELMYFEVNVADPVEDNVQSEPPPPHVLPGLFAGEFLD